MKRQILASTIMFISLFSILYILSTGLVRNVYSNGLNTVLFILLSSIYTSYRTKLNFGYVLLTITVPICACDILSSLLMSLGDSYEDGPESFLRMSERLFVVVYGAILSSIGYFLCPKEPDFLSAKPLNYYDIAILITALSVWLGFAVIPMGELERFLFLPSVIFAIAFISMSVSAAMLRGNRLSAAAIDGSVAAVLFGIVIAACLYFSSFRVAGTIGPILALSLISAIYGCIFYYAGFFITIKQQTISTVSFTTKNWHIIEAVAFLVFMVYGPPTIWEASGLNLVLPTNISNPHLNQN